MVFLTVQSLIDFVADTKRISTNWIGEDSGKVYFIQKKKGKLLFSRNGINFQCNENEFKIALLKECQRISYEAKKIHY